MTYVDNNNSQIYGESQIQPGSQKVKLRGRLTNSLTSVIGKNNLYHEIIGRNKNQFYTHLEIVANYIFFRYN